MKKVLMIINYFYPDVASTGQLMTEICEELQNDFQITVIAAFPNYTGTIPEQYKSKYIVKEKYQSIDIIRVKVPEFDKSKKASRIKYILMYFFMSIIAIFKSGKQDLVFTMSQPPILGGILGRIGKFVKRAKMIYNIQDYNPEQIEAVGYSKNKLVVELARKIDKRSCRVSDNVLIVGRDMQQTLEKRFEGKHIPNNTVINNWIDEKSIYPLNSNDLNISKFKKKYGIEDKFIFMYSGNIGLYYDLENIIKVIGEFRNEEDIAFVFVGEGAVKQSLVNYCSENNISNVSFIPYQNKEDLIYSLNAADVHVVTNAKGIKGVSVPSKIYGVMAAGKAVLGILEDGSEARKLVEDSNCGYCCEPGNYEEIKKLIILIKEAVEKGNIEPLNGRKYLEQNLSKEKSINKYRELFNSLLNR